MTALEPRIGPVSSTDEIEIPEDPTASMGHLWLSHHYACDADRCARVGDQWVCRRCFAQLLGFLPAMAFLIAFGADVLEAGEMGFILATTIVAGIEFSRVVQGRERYSAQRVWLLNPAVGMVMAWLGYTAAVDGFGPVHFVLIGVGAALLGLVLVSGTVLGRGR